MDFTPGEVATATLDVACGKGTYIRTLCADMGAALGVGGHMAALRRTRVGAFRVEAATPLADLTEENLPGLLVSPADALAEMPAHRLATEADEKTSGMAARCRLRLPHRARSPRSWTCGGELCALGRADGEQLRPFKVFRRRKPCVPFIHFKTSPETLQDTAVAIGVFDGVHRGHQEILKQTVREARSQGLTPLALTFDIHPTELFAPDAVAALHRLARRSGLN